MTELKLKLTYFNTKGLCEGARYIFAYADVEYEDFRIEHSEWPPLKNKQPFGTLPVLEVDGKVFDQSIAICRFLGRRFGFVAENPLQDAFLDALVDHLRDLIAVLVKNFQNKTPETDKAAAESMQSLFTKLDNLAPNGYFCGSKPTWADMYFSGFIDTMKDHQPDVLNPYPNLAKIVSNITSKDSVQKYIAKRPPPMPMPVAAAR